jgi:antitoxin component YwqK of YwqJK toxin-antitoxin module
MDLNLTIDYLKSGLLEYSSIDTTYFEPYWNCGMDNGLRLKENLSDGIYKVHYNDTLKYSAVYKNNKKNGIWTNYYSNGKISSTQNYSNGLTNGKYVKLNQNGDTTTTYETVNGELYGSWITTNSNGIVTYIAIYNDDDTHITTEYSETGTKERTREFKDGLYHGKMIEFYEDGAVKREILYDMDRTIKYTYYDQLGNITQETVVGE